MKKTSLIVTVMLCLFLFSCKKDKNSVTSASIVGKWTITSNLTSYYNKDGKLLNTEEATDSPIMIFNSNGSAISVLSDGENIQATYAISTTNGKKNIKITYVHSEVMAYEIVVLTDHNLELQDITVVDSQDQDYLKTVTDVKMTR